MKYFSTLRTEIALKVSLALTSSLVPVTLYFFNPFSVEQVDQMIQKSGYYLCALITGLLAFCIYRVFASRLRLEWPNKEVWLVLLAILPVGVFIHLHEPHRFKVLNDEYAISSIAKQMHLERIAAVPGQVHVINQQVWFESFYADKRSQLFSFLVSISHDLTGFRPHNVFWVNGVLTFGLLILIYASIAKVTDSRILGYWACLFAASIPLLSQVATGAGYDLANVFFIWLLIYAALHFVNKPSKAAMNALIMCGLALSYTRYESVLYLIPVVFLIAHWWWRERQVQLSLFAALSPLLLLLPVLLNLRMSENDVFKDLSLRSDGVAFFGWHYIIPNLKIALSYFFSPTSYNTASVFCSAVGLLGLVFIGVTFLTRGFRKGGESALVGGCVSGIIGLCFMIVMANFWGQLDDAQAVRFALPLYIGSLFGAAILLREVLKGRLGPWVIGLQAIYLFIFIVPSVAKHATTKEMVSSYFQEWVIQTVQAQDDKRILLLVKSNVGAGLFGLSSLPLAVANAEPHLAPTFARDYKYDEVWVAEMQDFNSTQNEWESVKLFGVAADWMWLESLYQQELFYNVRGRISRLDLDEIQSSEVSN